MYCLPLTNSLAKVSVPLRPRGGECYALSAMKLILLPLHAGRVCFCSARCHRSRSHQDQAKEGKGHVLHLQAAMIRETIPRRTRVFCTAMLPGQSRMMQSLMDGTACIFCTCLKALKERTSPSSRAMGTICRFGQCRNGV